MRDLERHAGRTPVLVDDLISTGRTMIETARQLVRAGFRGAVRMGVHAVFADEGYEELSAVADQVVTCDTIAHPSNGIEVASAIAPAIEELRRSSVVAGTVADQRLRPARGESR